MRDQLVHFLACEKANLEKVNNELQRFDPFEVLGVGHYEIRHSNVLGWLLDPNGNHGFQSFILDNLIRDIAIDSSFKTSVLLSNHDDTIVNREKDQIDIEVVNRSEGWAIVIENKFYSGLSGASQLKRYLTKKQDQYDAQSVDGCFLFLSPRPFNLDAIEEGDSYEQVLYSKFAEYINAALDSFSINEEVRNFLKQYLFNLNRRGMTTNENPSLELAHRIYLENKEALDYIIANKPTIYSEKNFNLVKGFFKNEFTDKYILFSESNSIIRVLPKDVAHAFEGYEVWNSNYFFAIELFLEGERLWVKFCFGDHGQNEDRLKLKLNTFNKMKEFKSLSSDLWTRARPEAKYSGVAGRTIMTIVDSRFSSMSFEDFFKEAWIEFEEKLLDKWIEEVKENLLEKT